MFKPNLKNTTENESSKVIPLKKEPAPFSANQVADAQGVVSNLLKGRVELALLTLFGLFLGLAVAGYMLSNITMDLLDMAPLVLYVDKMSYPLFVGKVSMSVFLLTVNFIFLDLISEYFGKRTALLTCFVSALSVVALWGVLKAIPLMPAMVNPTQTIWAMQTLFDKDVRDVLSYASVLFVGMGIQTVIYNGIRKMTRGKYTIIRLFFSRLLGGLFPAAVGLVALYWPLFDVVKVSSQIVIQYVQWASLGLFMIPLFYFIQFPFYLIVGSAHATFVHSQYKKKNEIIDEDEITFFTSRKNIQQKRI